MPKVIDPVVRSKAVVLREAGKTYKDIALELGVSQRWVANELSGIRTTKQKLVDELCTRGQTKYGVSKGEIYYDMKLHELDKQSASAEMKNVTQKIKYNNQEALVRPDWMFPLLAQFITKRVLRFVIETEDRFEEEANEIHTILMDSCTTEDERKLVPSVKKLKATYAHMMNMLCDQSPEKNMKVQSYFESIQTIANELQNRNASIPVDTEGQTKVDSICLDLDNSDIPY